MPGNMPAGNMLCNVPATIKGIFLLKVDASIDASSPSQAGYPNHVSRNQSNPELLRQVSAFKDDRLGQSIKSPKNYQCRQRHRTIKCWPCQQCLPAPGVRKRPAVPL